MQILLSKRKTMGNDFKRRILHVSLAISAMLFSIHAFETPTSPEVNNVIALCNGTITEDCVLNVNGENHLAKRSLQGGSASRHICYGAIQRPSICNANTYGNCIVPVGPSYRPCTVYTRCKRGIR
ncbi:Uncharacterized protein TCM_018923 [Theobroma cacao]|uniref:Uncharacterized protein n=1 Tax=Theobroma cacao TaxID=3641 RepID=A0A061EFI2_THECC|nr:Uncharacterized protein TCM_018923 [Theobroma cacao]